MMTHLASDLDLGRHLGQTKGDRLMLDDRLAESLAFARVGKRRVVRSLWGRDSHSRFRTHGRDSVATVRGTRWVTTDRCDGTLTRVTQGKVSVRDLHRKRSVLVSAGHAYLARHRHH